MELLSPDAGAGRRDGGGTDAGAGRRVGVWNEGFRVGEERL